MIYNININTPTYILSSCLEKPLASAADKQGAIIVNRRALLQSFPMCHCQLEP